MTPRSKRFRRTVLFGLLVLAQLSSGCGSKSPLTVPEGAPTDAGDAGFDTTPPVVDSGLDTSIPFDECIELPPEDPPTQVRVQFESRISNADVLFLVDTTGSMMDEIEQVRATLREVLVPSLVETIGDVNLSVASLADFPVGMYGSDADDPFVLLSESDPDVRVAQMALDRLPMSAGADGPESQTEALYQAATGEGIGRYVPRARCAPGRVGYPCFRADGSRIILLFTDAPFHNGPSFANSYGSDVVPTPHTYGETVAALNAIGARVLGLFSGGAMGGEAAEALQHLRAIASDTGAVTPDGEPIVVDIGTDGRMLDSGVVESVRTLVEEVLIDIDIIAEDIPGDDLDALTFVRGFETIRATPRDGAEDRGDRFDAVRPGTTVAFRVLLDNEDIARGLEPREYFLQVVLRGERVTRLSTTVVRVVIPSLDGRGCEG